MKGFTLIETIIVVVIITSLTLIGMIKINQFREDVIFDLAAEEFIETIRLARAKSMTGEISDGETEGDFEKDGLPSFGVDVNANTYSIFREYTTKGNAIKTREDIEKTTLDTSFTIKGNSEVVFPRITGKAIATFVIEKKNSSQKREINITEKGVITINKL